MADGLPALTDLWDDYSDVHDQFEIVSIHFSTRSSESSLSEVWSKLEERKIVSTQWGNRLPPFQVLLDRDATTWSRYQASMYPAMFLLDRQGKLIDASEQPENRLKQELNRIRKQG